MTTQNTEKSTDIKLSKIAFIVDSVIEFGVDDEGALGNGFNKLYDADEPLIDLLYEIINRWKNDRGNGSNP